MIILDPAAECIDVDHAQILRVGAHDIAVVTVVFVLPPSEQLVSGSAIVRPQQEADAIARAVLDATNRRGRPIECRVTAVPLVADGSDVRGAILLMEAAAEA